VTKSKTGYTQSHSQFSSFTSFTATPSSGTGTKLVVNKGGVKGYYFFLSEAKMLEYMTKWNADPNWLPGAKYQKDFILRFGTKEEQAAVPAKKKYSKPHSRRQKTVTAKPLTMHQKAAAFDKAQSQGLLTVAKKQNQIEVFINLSPLPASPAPAPELEEELF
jgi:hypothetical protein